MSVAGAITRAAAALMPRLSFPLASAVGSTLGSLAWAVDQRHRDIAVRNLAIAFPRMPESRRKNIALRAFQQAGRTATEILWSTSLDDDTLAQIAVFEGLEHVHAAREAGNGVILTTAHFGNWELMGVALAQIGTPIDVIARRLDDPAVDEVLHRLRTRTGSRVIYKDEAVRGALRTLRDGRPIGVLIDQNTVPRQATFVPFFGRPAATTEIIAQLHVRTGAPIIMVFCIPQGHGYRFVFEPLTIDAHLDDRDDAVHHVTAAATLHIERHIRAHPEAWLWVHDRWRTRPPETTSA